MSCGTESNALVKSNEKIRIKSASLSSRLSHSCWHLTKAMVVLRPLRYANWSEPIELLITLESSHLKTTLSKSLIIILVNDIGLSWLQVLNGVSLGKGMISAIFHKEGTVWHLSEQLKTWDMIGARSKAKSLHSQKGSWSGPAVVLFKLSRKLQTVKEVTSGILVPSGIDRISGSM